jgi:hypothetical protein
VRSQAHGIAGPWAYGKRASTRPDLPPSEREQGRRSQSQDFDPEKLAAAVRYWSPQGTTLDARAALEARDHL